MQNIETTSPTEREALSKYEDFSDGCVLTELGMLHRHRKLTDYTSITPAAAKLFVEFEKYGGTFGFDEFKNVSHLSVETAKELSKIRGRLELPAVTQLDVEVAEAFANGEYPICFDGVKELTQEAAVAISKRAGGLRLNGLEELSPAVAAAFEHTSMELELGGIKTLDEESARHLSTHEGRLCLDGIESISESAIDALANHRGDVDMNGLQELSDDAANALLSALNISTTYVHVSKASQSSTRAEPEEPSLKRAFHSEVKRFFKARDLDSVTRACRMLADAIANDGDWLECFKAQRLERIMKTQDTELILVVAEHICHLPNVVDEFLLALSKNHSEEVVLALFLADNERDTQIVSHAPIEYPGFQEMDDELAIRLCNHEGAITMRSPQLPSGLEATKAQQSLLKKLVRHNRDGWLIHQENAIEPEFAEILSSVSGILRFYSLQKLSEEMAVALGNHHGELCFEAIESISDDAARGLENHFGDLSFSRLKSLSAAAATSLAKNSGTLWLDGLIEMSAEVAAGLAKNTHKLSLDGITVLSGKAASELAKTEADLSFGRDFVLSLECAEALSSHKGDLSLRWIESITPEAANAISKHHGRVDLFNVLPLSLECAIHFAQSPGEIVVCPAAVRDDFPEEVKLALSR